MYINKLGFKSVMKNSFNPNLHFDIHKITNFEL